MGQIRVRIHSEARELAQHGRDRIKRADETVPEKKDRQYPSGQKGDHGMAEVQK